VNFNARVASDINPATDNTYDLGVTGHEWRNLNIDGTANIDSLVADTADINGGTIDDTAIGATTPAAGSFTTLTASATTSLLLGTAGSAVGNVGFRNADSGTTTLAPATGALGTGTVTLPLSGTLATTAAIPTTVYVGAAEMIPKSTAGCGVNSSETSTNKTNYDTLDFDATTAEGAQFIRTLPSNWNAGNITAVFHWTADSGSGTVTFSLSGYSFGDNVSLDTAQGTLQSATDTLQTAGAMHLSPATSAITIGGTPTVGVPVIFEVKRDIADTLAVDARLLGVSITYTSV
jgi:hypothetical protein